ncbi:hypothetical protein Ga0100231_011920 [Opitutaceae bacterium TAV4]|nr:hypothetical protein Ga0100231_011920 [Opitutaceae bacterium TAV4]RRJ98909.1 hypothetical protein Ga0100230_011450 [Opitutaceae bacterium TAV3]
MTNYDEKTSLPIGGFVFMHRHAALRPAGPAARVQDQLRNELYRARANLFFNSLLTLTKPFRYGLQPNPIQSWAT